MKLGEVYEFVVKKAIEVDPRGKELVERNLKKTKRLYEELKKEEKEIFDLESLKNPYSDTRILYGDTKREIKAALVGIDIEVGELLLADRLRRVSGKRIDLAISHHPEGMAWAGFYDVMHMQVDILGKVGVPINVAEALLRGRIEEVERKVLPANHTRAVDAAKLLDVPFMCIHTASDNFVASYMQKLLDRKGPDTVGDILEILRGIPEYKEAIAQKAGPKVVVGSRKNRVGKVFVEMTGGTEGSKEVFEKLSQAGVGTIVGMHLSEGHIKKVKEQHINVVIAGHISSDNLGLNLLLDEIEKKGRLEVIPCSGFRRVRRR